MFATLQQNVFPAYFTSSMVLSSALLSAWIYSHPVVLTHYLEPTVPEVAQAYALGVVLVSSLINRLYTIPTTTKYVARSLHVARH